MRWKCSRQRNHQMCKRWILIASIFICSRLKPESMDMVTISLTALFTSISYDIAIKRPPLEEAQFRLLREGSAE
jgi:hypothetical protein